MESFTIDHINHNAEASCVNDEIQDLRRNIPKVQILTATKDFLTATYQRSPYTKVKLSLTFPESYPERPLIVTVTSDKVVPPGLKKKLEKDLTEVATNLKGSHDQVCAVMQRLVSFVDQNKFLPCWRERKQCVDLIISCNQNANSSTADKGQNLSKSNGRQDDVKPSSIAFVDSKGKMKLRFASNKYYYSCTIVVDDGYPSTITHQDWGQACHLTMDSTNFPPKIETMLTTQAKELVRRMQDGMNAEDALQMSNPIRKPKNYKENSKDKHTVRLTQEVLKGLKKDTDTLQRVKDLRDVDSAVTQGNARVKAYSAKARKDARRTINKITDQEITKDQEQEEKEKMWQQQEKARLAGYNISEFDGTNPQPSLLSLTKFLIHKIQRLPYERCPCCKQLTLPQNPKELELLYLNSSNCKTEKEKKARKLARQSRPVRTYCGCWYHYSCLHKFMTEPPFGSSCPTDGCGRRVYHPDWPDDIKQLEKAWASEQARKREIEDAAMFL